jgi:transposase
MRTIKLSQYAKEQGVKYATVWNRYLSHWAYALIKDKLIRLGETEGFCVSEVPNEFRSQRCSSCGWVRKANRKGKTFKCTSCNFSHDADLNAASNLALDLFKVPFWVRLKKLNKEGFFWKPDGLFSLCQEPIVPDAQK